MELLNILERPAICVKDGKVSHVNQAGNLYSGLVGKEISFLLGENYKTYQTFQNGILYTKINLDGAAVGVAVIKDNDIDYFLPETEYTEQSLQTMALVAQQLRAQINSVMTISQDRTVSSKRQTKQEKLQNAQINRGLFRLQRTVGNMSDITRYKTNPPPMVNLDISYAVYEILEKATALLKEADVSLKYSVPDHSVFTQANYEMLERAIYNLLSNAVKFSGENRELDVNLSHKGKYLLLTVNDHGCGISEDMYSTIFNRYLRQPGIEDGLQGLGLGMSLVQTVANAHGGTVLITGQEDGGTKITVTFAVRPGNGAQLRSPILSPVDYAGGFDHGLIELSDVIPAELYDGKF